MCKFRSGGSKNLDYLVLVKFPQLGIRDSGTQIPEQTGSKIIDLGN
jgi:hypothetical protein